MEHCELSLAERHRRKNIVGKTRNMILSKISVEGQDETSLMMDYGGYYLQISFSELHPLMVFCLAKALKKPSTTRQGQMTNELNLKSILGCHAINDEVGCYSYRATHWLDVEWDEVRFYEILDRCVDEAEWGYHALIK